MTTEQQLEKLLNDLSEIKRYNLPENPDGSTILEHSQDGGIVLWQDIEAILKQNFPEKITLDK